MKKKHVMFILLMCIIGISVLTSVSASDLNETVTSEIDDDGIEDASMELSVGNVEVEKLSLSEDTEVIATNYTPRNFDELKTTVNNANDGDTIILRGTFSFDSTITVNKKLNFVGQLNAVVDGKSKVQLFSVSSQGVTFKDITFKNGYATYDGGAIYGSNWNINPTAENCIFINNFAKGRGAAIFRGNAINCRFENNIAYNTGGACYLYSRYNYCTNCIFINNSAVCGGGICSEDAGANVINCTFINNYASDNGGAYYDFDDSGNGQIKSCYFLNNCADKDGGAIYSTRLTSTIEESTFINNSANNGGAIFTARPSVSNCNFSNNSALNRGGSVFIDGGGKVSNSNFTNNFASVRGGAIYSQKTGYKVTNSNFNNNFDSLGSSNVIYQTFLNVEDVLIMMGNKAFLNATLSSSHGSLSNKKITFILDGIKYYANTNNKGLASVEITQFLNDEKTTSFQAIFEGDESYDYVSSNGVVCVIQSKNHIGTAFSNIKTAVMYSNNGDTITLDGYFYNDIKSQITIDKQLNFVGINNATLDANQFSRIFEIKNVFVSFNQITFKNGNSDKGGAILSEGTTIFYDCNFLNNTVNAERGSYGGAIYTSNECDFNGCNFIENIVYGSWGSYGGAIYSTSSSYITDCNFKSNKVDATWDGHGGAIYYSGDCTLNGCNFIDNTAYAWSGGYGGAIYSTSSSFINDCNFVRNTAVDSWDGYGGAVYSTGTVNSKKCTFEENVGRYGTSNSNFFITVDDIDVILGEDGFLSAKLFDISNGLSNKELIFTINGNDYNVLTDSKGIATLNVKNYFNNIGEYDVKITYSGSGGNTAVSANAKIMVKYKPSLYVNDLFFNINEEGIINAVLSNENDKIADKNITFLVNNQEINVVTDSNGIASLNIKNYLTDLGEYDIEIIFAGDESYCSASAISNVIIYNNTINVNDKMFSAIQLAIDNSNDGDIIYLEGDYSNDLINNSIVVNKKLIIYGRNNAVLDFSNNQNSVSSIMLVQSNEVSIKNIVYKNGNSTSGAAINSKNAQNININNCTFISNSASDYGGAIYCSSAVLSDCTFVNNSAISYEIKGASDSPSAYGGAIYCNYAGSVVVNNCVFINNSAISGGGAIRCGSAVVSNCVFVNNSASDYGGGAIYGDSVVIGNCVFVNNSAISDGGAIEGYSVVVRNSTFISNLANRGIIYYYHNGLIKDSDFINNHANYGGAIYLSFFIDTNDFLEVDNCNFINNSATYGGSFYCQGDGLLNVTNCHFANNYASSKGGSIYISKGLNNFYNCYFVNNTANECGVIYVYEINNIKLDSCIFENNSATVGGIANSFLEVTKLVYGLGDDGFLQVRLYSLLGPLANKDIVFNINWIDYTSKTDNNGIASFNVKNYYNKIGDYYITISFAGDDSYASVSRRSNFITVKYKSFLNVSDLSSQVDEGVLKVNLSNNIGPLANKIIKFTINHDEYVMNTDSEGIAFFKIKDYYSDLGNYSVIISYEGDNSNIKVSSNVITVLNKYDSVLDTRNISFVKGKTGLITVNLSNVKGPQKNKEIIFNVNGINYTRTTLSNGITNFNFNDYLNELGEYNVSVIFKGDDLNNPISKNIVVRVNSYKGILSLNQNGKYYNDSILEVKLVDYYTMEGIANATIEIVFSNNKTVYLTTDSNGFSNYSVPFIVGNYNFIAKVVDDNADVDDIEVNDFIINEIVGVIEIIQNGTIFNNSNLIVKLYNPNNGDVYRNTKVNILFITNGETSELITNDDGIAIYPIPFNFGTYHVLAYVSGEFTQFFNVEKDIEINKINSSVNAEKIVFSFGGTGSTSLTVVGGKVLEKDISVLNHNEAEISFNNGIVYVSGLDVGHYTLQVITTPDLNYNPVTSRIDITVNKIRSNVGASNIVFEYDGVGVTTLILTGCSVSLDKLSVINHPEAIIGLSTNNVVSVSNLTVGNYTLKVITTPDDRYYSVTQFIPIIVNKVASNINGEYIIFDYGAVGSTAISVVGGSLSENKISVVGNNKAKISLNGDVVSVSNLDVGTYDLEITNIPDSNHYSVTKLIKIYVNEVDSSVNAKNIIFDYGGYGSTTLSVVGGNVLKNNIKVIGFEDEAKIDFTNNKVTVSGLNAGNYKLQVTTTPDSNHNPITKIINITVNKVDADIEFGNVISFSSNDLGSTDVKHIVGGSISLSTISVVDHDEAIISYDPNKKVISVSGLDEGTYILSVTVIPDSNHNSVTRTLGITVTPSGSGNSKGYSKISFSNTNLVFDYGSSDFTIVTVVGGTVERSGISVDGHPEAKINFAGNKITVSGLNVGTYTLRVKTTPFDNYYSVTETVSITVNKVSAVITAFESTVVLKKGTLWNIKIVDSRTNNPISNMKLTLKVYTKSRYETVYVITNSKGEAFYQTKTLSKGNHKVVVSGSHPGYKFNTVTSSIKVIKQTKLNFKVKKNVANDGSSLSITVKKGKKPINKVKIKLLVYTGKKLTKTVILKSKKKGKYTGVCGWGTNKLTASTHKIVIKPVKLKYSGSKTVNLKVKKAALKHPKWETKI